MKLGRTKKIVLNTTISMVGYLISATMNFIYRTIFIHSLGNVYLGIQGLFINIISLLSLADMGISSAITFSMYKPLSQNNTELITTLIAFYRKVYRIIAIVVLAIGFVILPFIDFFIDKRPDIPESLEVIFILYVINSVFTYISISNHSILNADQNEYIITLFNNALLVIRTIIQIVWVFKVGTFIPTLIIQFICTLAGNVLISIIARNKYPYIKNKNKRKLSKENLKEISEKIRAMFLYRVGAFVVNGTDNILMSKFIGIATVGIYSNYTMLIGIIKTFTGYLCSSLTPSIGNHIAIKNDNESKDEMHSIFNILYFMFFWISSFTAVCLSSLLNPFITLWINDTYVLSELIVLFIIINYYIYSMRRLMIVYRNALGLYIEAKYKPVIEAIINLVMSIVLLNYMGVLGIVVGTIISDVATGVWIEPYILYKKYFKTDMKKYWGKYFLYFLITIIEIFVVMFLSKLIFKNTILSFILICLITVTLPNLVIISLFNKTNEFAECLKRVKTFFKK